MADIDPIVELVRPMLALMGDLHTEDRMALLCGLLAQEVCTLPTRERRPKLRELMGRMPGILDDTEEGMRQVLLNNARRGL